jgi:uncharacterized glyoxalase superfamily protein PhnB
MADAPAPIAVQLFYADVQGAVTWLCRAFGFTEAWTLAPQGELLMASLATPGGGGVMISGGAPPSPSPNPWSSVTVMVPDVDAHATRARAEGATLLSEPADQPWGYRDYEVLDHDGRQWNFSQVLHAATPEDWGASGPSTSG